MFDPHDLALQVMQSFANFTVGGSLSVNAHGRHVGQGPIVTSVASIRPALADGAVVHASPSHNSELFYGAIGGYGALGVIVEATLRVTDNGRLERRTQVMPFTAYRQFFATHIAANPDAVMHNATLYPDDFTLVRTVTFSPTNRAVTQPNRLGPSERDDRLEHRILALTAGSGCGKGLRQRILEPLLYTQDAVEWRNYQSGLDVRSLTLQDGGGSVYPLQEYFVPVAAMERFADWLRAILRRHRVNAINVSIRHARQLLSAVPDSRERASVPCGVSASGAVFRAQAPTRSIEQVSQQAIGCLQGAMMRQGCSSKPIDTLIALNLPILHCHHH